MTSRTPVTPVTSRTPVEPVTPSTPDTITVGIQNVSVTHTSTSRLPVPVDKNTVKRTPYNIDENESVIFKKCLPVCRSNICTRVKISSANKSVEVNCVQCEESYDNKWLAESNPYENKVFEPKAIPENVPVFIPVTQETLSEIPVSFANVPVESLLLSNVSPPAA